jgi:Transposase.
MAERRVVTALLAKQLGITDSGCLIQYAASERRRDHTAEIRERCGYRQFSDPSVQWRFWLAGSMRRAGRARIGRPLCSTVRRLGWSVTWPRVLGNVRFTEPFANAANGRINTYAR